MDKQVPAMITTVMTAIKNSCKKFKVHYHIHKDLPSGPVLNYMHPVHAFTPHFLTFILILSSHPQLGLSSGLFF
jgi:hypothetical protein